MSNLKTFLKVLNNVGYPNPKIATIAKMANYNLFDIIPNLIDEIGEDGTDSFVKKALSKLSTNKGIKVPLSGNEYAYIIIHKSKDKISAIHRFPYI